MSGTIAQRIFRPVIDGLVQMEPITVDEYHALIESGRLPEDTSIELLNGFLTVKDRSAAGGNPMVVGNDHILAVQKMMRLAAAIDSAGSHLRIQQPIALRPNSEPEPDASIVIGKAEDYARQKPKPADVICVVEVADSSLGRDRTLKLDVYAAAGVPTYIILNLPDRVVEVHTQPIKASARYRRRQVLRGSEVLKLPVSKSKSIEVSAKELLP